MGMFSTIFMIFWNFKLLNLKLLNVIQNNFTFIKICLIIYYCICHDLKFTNRLNYLFYAKSTFLLRQWVQLTWEENGGGEIRVRSGVTWL